MRLNRLDLTRYGKFTDHVINFGARTEGAADLHIVYGPNEAGKSTLFSAWLDLLFGIGAQSSYNFLHPYPNMRIGAAIEIDGKTQDFVRIKRPQNSLLDGRDQTVSDGALLAGLGGLDRDSYQTMFSLDDESLEQGGESILASRGDLGELLFSASAGLGELSQRLVQIRTETEEFYKPRAQKRILSELKSELAELKAERDLIDTQASKYAQLNKDLDEARSRHAEAGERRKHLRIRLTAVDRLLNARPRLADIERLSEQLEPLMDLPAVAPEWRQQVRDLGNEEASLTASGEALNEEIDRLSAELETIGVDAEILSLQDRLTELDRLRTRHDAAGEDLPERRTALGRIDGRIEQFLVRLGRAGEPDAEQLLLNTSRTAALRDLIDARSSLDVRLTVAKKEAADAKASRDDANAHLQSAGGDPAQTTPERRQSQIAALSETLTLLRNDDHGLRRQTAKRAVAAAREKSAALIDTLSPWQGDTTELRAMQPPSPDTLRKWKSEIEETGRKLDVAREDITRLTHSLKRFEAEAGAVAQSRALLSATETDSLRAARDLTWANHKASLDADTATSFEAAMRAYDEAADKRASHQADVAKLNEIAVQTAIATTELEGATATKTKLESALAELSARIAKSIEQLSASLPTEMTIETLETWLHRREMAIEADETLRAHLRDLETAGQDRQAAVDRMVRALEPLDPELSTEDDLETLVTRGQHLVSQETRLEGYRQTLAEQERILTRRERDVRTAEEEAKVWMLAWKEACDGCWLGEGKQAPTAAEVREALPVLGELATAIHDRASLADRIAKMERDQADYTAALQATALSAGIETDAVPPAAIARHLTERLATAEKARTRHEDLSRKIEEATSRQRNHSETLAAHAARKSQMLDALGAETLADAALRTEQALERKQLALRIEQIASEIRETLGAGSLEEARAQLEATDAAELSAEKQDLEASLEKLDAEVQHLFAAQSRASEAMNAVGGDDAVARIEQSRKTILLAIADGAERYLRLSAGIIAMEQALTLYRERHSSSMMQRASEAIRTISRGRYRNLASQPDKGRELLIAIQNDGTSKQAAEMSKGARFQLYLALRVAGFHEFAASRQTVPFIADDIMETFDDFRAEETFRLFAGMAGVGQVIYLTHHSHLCDIARSVCPDVKIHELTA
ncbi:AAA family ATPase [Hoeflea sp. AS60]|uniref:AAA family ATPase n=1 Tax=Hoeflea sp. AS60 TaxID=3135780 RepID=UPI00316F36AD